MQETKKKAQTVVKTTLENLGWKLGIEESTDVLKCHGRISGYQPIYIAGGEFANKLTRHIHEDIKHLGVANTMPTVREGYWIPHLRAKVKKVINDCKVCKVFSAQRYGPAATAPLPSFRTERGRPFETTGIDFAGQMLGKWYMLIFKRASFKSTPFRSNQVKKSGGVQGEAECFY